MDEQIAVERSLVGAVAGEQIQVREALVGAIAAKQDVSITNGGVGAIAARQDVSITNGGSGPIAAVGNVSIVNGGAKTIATLGGATLGERSFVAFVLAPKVTIEAGAKVLMSTPQALAAGAAVGVVIALLGRRRR
jgi:hypothetical protein